MLRQRKEARHVHRRGFGDEVHDEDFQIRGQGDNGQPDDDPVSGVENEQGDKGTEQAQAVKFRLLFLQICRAYGSGGAGHFFREPQLKWSAGGSPASLKTQPGGAGTKLSSKTCSLFVREIPTTRGRAVRAPKRGGLPTRRYETFLSSEIFPKSSK
jgi:hypothetical protein